MTAPLVARHQSRISALHASSPRPIQDFRNDSHKEEQTAYSPADDVKMATYCGDGISEGAMRLSDVLHQGQQLNDANEGGHEDCDCAENDLVVEQGDGVSGEGFGCVEEEHGGAVEGV